MLVTVSASAALAIAVPELSDLQMPMLWIDIVALGLKSTIALTSTRRWPIWVAAFQLNTVLASIAIIVSPTFRNEFYYTMATLWAMPTLFVMVFGTWLDTRAPASANDRDGAV